jgi:hypothetical protein
MANPIFAVPRYYYQSYSDLYSLIELSGFESVYFDELDPASDNTYILTIYNGEIEAGWNSARARIIFWDNELRYTHDYPHIPGVSEVWVSDKWYDEYLYRKVDYNVRFVPLASHPGLCIGALTDERWYDVAFLGYNIPRRGTILHECEQRGLAVSPTSAWGNERHKILTHAKALIHIHQHYEFPTIAPLRTALAAAYRMPLIMETPGDRGVLRSGDVLTADYDYLPDMAALWTRRTPESELAKYGQELYHSLCERLTFRSAIEAVL